MNLLRKSFSIILAAGLVILGLTSVNTIDASAAVSPNPYVQPVIQKIYDGTGQGTPSGTFINKDNGYFPGDNTPTDGVVSSNDTVGYKINLQFGAGLERTVDVAIELPEFLYFDSKTNINLCSSSGTIKSSFIGDTNNPVCRYIVPRGSTGVIETNLTLTAKDTAGEVQKNQKVKINTKVADSDGFYSTVEAAAVTVISAPVADLLIRPSNCTNTNNCSPINNSSLENSFIIFPELLKYPGYDSTKGSSSSGFWNADLDISGMPTVTKYFINDSEVFPVNNILQLPKTTGPLEVKTVILDENWGGEVFEDGDSRNFPVHLIVNRNSFSTENYLNNGDGWQPGQDKDSSFNTRNERNSGASTGYVFKNNDWTAFTVIKPTTDVSPGSIFGHSLFRPYDASETIWENGNIYFEDSRNEHLVYGNGKQSQVTDNTELKTKITLNTKNVSTNDPIIIANNWNTNLKNITAPLTVINTETNEVLTDYIVQWSKLVTGSEMLNIENNNNWVTSKTPIDGAASFRIIFKDLPIGENGSNYSITALTQVTNNYSGVRPISVNDNIYALSDAFINEKTLNVILVDKPVQTLGLRVSTQSNNFLNRDTNDILYNVTPVIYDLISSSETFSGNLTLTLDSCVTDVIFDDSQWVEVSRELGSGCNNGNPPINGKIILKLRNDEIAPSNQFGTGSFPILSIKTKISLLASGPITFSGEWNVDNEEIIPVSTASKNIIAEELGVILEQLTSSTEKEEPENILKWNATIYSKIAGESANASETVMVLPGKGQDSDFINTLNSIPGNEAYSGAEESNFSGTYTLKNAKIVDKDSVEGSQVLCTEKDNPNLEPNQANANWSTICGPNTTALKIVQPGGDNQGVSSLDIELEPIGNKKNDIYLMWIGSITIPDTEVNAMAWPVENLIVSSEITGYVYWEEEGEGYVYNENLKGISNTKVDLVTLEGNIVKTVFTDDDGYYIFEDVLSGVYNVKISNYPSKIDSAVIPGKELNVEQTFSYPNKRMGSAIPETGKIDLEKNQILENVNFGFFAPDPYSDVKKTSYQADCSNPVYCNLTWDIEIVNGARVSSDEILGGNVPLSNGILTDTMVGDIYNVEGYIRSKIVKVASSDDQTAADRMSHVLALTENGEVYAWGNNNAGQIGNGITQGVIGGDPNDFFGKDGGEWIPIRVDIPEKIKDVITGDQTSYAISESGNLYAWGGVIERSESDYIAGITFIGNGTKTGSLTPQKIDGLENVEKLATGVTGTFVTLENGDVYSWGNNGSLLGINEDYQAQILSPTKSDFLTNIGMKQIFPTINSINTLGITNDGKIISWGGRQAGEWSYPESGYFEAENINNAKAMFSVYSSSPIFVNENNELYGIRVYYGGSGNFFEEVERIEEVDKVKFLPTDYSGFYGDYNIIDSNNEIWTINTQWGDFDYLEKSDVNIKYKDITYISTSASHASLSSGGIVYTWGGGFPAIDLGKGYPYDRKYSFDEIMEIYENDPERLEELMAQSAGLEQIGPVIRTWDKEGQKNSMNPIQTKVGENETERIYSIPDLLKGESISVTFTGRVNKGAEGFRVGNQAWYTSEQTPRSAPTIVSPVTGWDIDNPLEYGPWNPTPNTNCTATDDWVIPGDQCDQVYNGIPTTSAEIGNLSGNVTYQNNPLENVTVTLFKGINKDGEVISSTITNSLGEYSFNNLPIGTDYYVQFTPQGKPAPGSSWVFAEKSNICPTITGSCADNSGITSNLTISDGITTENVNAILESSKVSMEVVKGYENPDTYEINQYLNANIGEEYDSVVIVITNTGEEELGSIELIDETNSGEDITWNVCYANNNPIQVIDNIFDLSNVSIQSESTPVGENWISCVGTLSAMGPDEKHEDTVKVNATSVSGTTVSEESTFIAETDPVIIPVPSIKLEKGVIDYSIEEDEVIKTEAMFVPGEDNEIIFKATNIGEENILDLTLSDTTTIGENTVKNITCEWPTAIVGGFTRNILYFDPQDGPTSAKCVGELTLNQAEVHENEAEVWGVGEISNVLVSDNSTFNAKASIDLPTTGETNVLIWVIVFGALSILVGIMIWRINDKYSFNELQINN